MPPFKGGDILPTYESTEEYLNSTQLGRQVIRIRENVSAALTAIGNKGVTVPSGANSDDLATLIGSIQTGGGSSVQTKTGTVTGEGSITLDIPCDFAPDLIYVYGDMSASANNRGVVSITILKDVFAYMSNDSSTSNTNENFTVGDHSISGYGDTSNVYATYSNGTLTIDTVNNTSARRFRSGQTYNYRLVKWT